MDTEDARTIWTVGHSTREVQVFIDLLHENRIAMLADVRRFPGSRRHPQFGSGPLAASLHEAGIGYHHFVALGGRRRPLPDSRNGVWRNPAFRGYADHMASSEFRVALATLTTLASEQRCAIMCAELLWWQCHRSMIADDLALHDWEVVHILGPGKLAPHALREPARLIDDVPIYGDGQVPLL
jgi:uncharacterized protein (DUF488 family)